LLLLIVIQDQEIVIDEYNGLLVENYNAINLAAAFNRMIVDRELYNICKKKCSQKCCAFIFRNDFKTMGIHFTLKQ
jgi:hypothetical protein